MSQPKFEKADVVWVRHAGRWVKARVVEVHPCSEMFQTSYYSIDWDIDSPFAAPYYTEAMLFSPEEHALVTLSQ